MKSFYEVYGLTAANPTIQTPPRSGQISRPQETWIKTMFGGQYNQDKLNYRDYREIMKDPQIKIARRLINNYLLSKKHHITPASASDEDKEISDFIDNTLKGLKTNLKETRKHLLSAIDYGYAVSEIIWDLNDESQIIISDIVSLQIETLENCFQTDKLGNIETVNQTVQGENDQNKIPVNKCIHYTFEGEAGNPYGESIYRSMNDIVYFKKKVLLWLAIFLQKHGSPALAGKVGPNGDADALLKQMEGIREGRTSLTHDNEDLVYILESSKNGDSFFRTFEMLEVLILRTFLIGSLVLGQSNSSGSYAQSQTHIESLKYFLDGIHEDLAILFQSIIKQLVDYNYTVEKYPQFTFDKFNDSDLIGLIKALQPYAQDMLLDSNNMEGLNQLIKRIFEEYGDIIVKQIENPETQTNQITNQDRNITLPTNNTNQSITGQVKDLTGV